MKRREKMFTIPVNTVDLEMIRLLAEQDDLPKATYVRKLVAARYAEVFGSKPPKAPHSP